MKCLNKLNVNFIIFVLFQLVYSYCKQNRMKIFTVHTNNFSYNYNLWVVFVFGIVIVIEYVK